MGPEFRERRDRRDLVTINKEEETMLLILKALFGEIQVVP